MKNRQRRVPFLSRCKFMEAITGYIEKLGFRQWVHDAHGISISGLDGVQFAEGGTAAEVEAFLAAYDELPAWKSQRAQEIKDEGVARGSLIYPGLTDLDDFIPLADIVVWMIGEGAAAPTGRLGDAAAIYTAAKNAIDVVTALVDVADVQAYDAVTDPAWP